MRVSCQKSVYDKLFVPGTSTADTDIFWDQLAFSTGSALAYETDSMTNGFCVMDATGGLQTYVWKLN